MQAAFEWSPLFETQLPEVDSQHQHLVDLLNRLVSSIDSSSNDQIDALLNDLAQYTVYHFRCEEQLMGQHGVLAQHQTAHHQAHQKFVDQVITWMATRHQHGQLSLAQMADYLANWLIFHILGEDQSLGRQIHAIQRGATPEQAYAADRDNADPRTPVLLGALQRLYGGLLERNESLLAAYQDLQSQHRELVNAQDQLATLNTHLEQRVRERTEALIATNRQLREEQGRLVQADKMAAIGQLAAGFAHEINTPIGIAVGTVSQLQQSAHALRSLMSQDEVQEEDLLGHLNVLDESSTLALANLNRAAGLVGAFKRSSIDQASEQVTQFRLRDLIQDDLLTLRARLKHSPAEVRVDCDPDWAIQGVPGLFHQLFTNLLLNAVQHGFQPDAVGAWIQVRVWDDQGRICIEVADNGRGMSPDVVEKIFQPFFTTSRGQGGTGLGLYICYDIVTNRLGGSIRCESAPDQGTRFLIEVPLEPPGAADAL